MQQLCMADGAMRVPMVRRQGPHHLRLQVRIVHIVFAGSIIAPTVTTTPSAGDLVIVRFGRAHVHMVRVVQSAHEPLHGGADMRAPLACGG